MVMSPFKWPHFGIDYNVESAGVAILYPYPYPYLYPYIYLNT